MRNVLAITSAFLLVGIFATAAGALNERLKPGDDFPGFMAKDLNGKMFFLKEHLGNTPNQKYKALIFSFCTSYCKPCRKEFPELEKLRAKYSAQGLGIFLIDVGENEEKAGALAAEIKTGLTMLVDRYGVVYKLVAEPGTPHTVLIDAAGKVRFVNTGFPEEKEKADHVIAELEKQIAAVLGAGGAGTSR
jgi:thiol-disulfide isomerase/thioredoxin